MLRSLASLLALLALSAAALAAPAQACAQMMEARGAATTPARSMGADPHAHHGGERVAPAPAHHGDSPCPHGECEQAADACDTTPSAVAPAAPMEATTPRAVAVHHPKTELAVAAPRAPPRPPRPSLSPVDLFIKQLN